MFEYENAVAENIRDREAMLDWASKQMKKLKQEDLDRICRKLAKESDPVQRNEKGEPIFTLPFFGTEKERKALQKKLDDLHDRK